MTESVEQKAGMKIIAIDPGSKESGVVRYDADGLRVEASSVMPNDTVLAMLRMSADDDAQLVIEQIESYGMAVGKTTFETVHWYGRFQEAWEQADEYDDGTYVRSSDRSAVFITRKHVKIHLCGCMSYRHPDIGNPMSVSNAQVRGALLERFPETGGGKTPQVGIKKQPGPLYGVTTHAWSALALAVVYAETNKGG